MTSPTTKTPLSIEQTYERLLGEFKTIRRTDNFRNFHVQFEIINNGPTWIRIGSFNTIADIFTIDGTAPYDLVNRAARALGLA